MAKIFVSHSSNDAELVTAFVDTVLDNGCQLSRQSIFCSSMHGTKTKPGHPNFISDLRNEMLEASIIILMLSPAYRASEYCLAELGATWILDKPVFPLIIPPLEKGKVQGLLQVTQIGSIQDKYDLFRLAEEIKPACKIEIMDMDNLSFQIDQFVDGKLPKIEIKQPDTVDYDTHQKLVRSYRTAQEKLAEAEKRLEDQEILINKLLLQDTNEDRREEWFISLPHTKQFEVVLSELKDTLSDFSAEINEAIYYHSIGEEYYSRKRGADRAVEDGYLIKNETNLYWLNKHDPKMRKALDALDALEGFITSASKSFRKAFEEKHEMQFELNRRFWNQFISNIGK